MVKKPRALKDERKPCPKGQKGMACRIERMREDQQARNKVMRRKTRI